MRVSVIVSDNAEIGPLSDEEKSFLDKVRAAFAEGIDIPAEKICTGTAGWSGALGNGALIIQSRLTEIVHEHPIDAYGRLAGLAHPWIPPGEHWESPESSGIGCTCCDPPRFHYHYFMHWKITYRTWESLETYQESLKSWRKET